MSMIRVLESSTIWPYSLGQLRADEPARSFSSSPSDAELAEYGVFRVQATAQLSYDPAEQKVIEAAPAPALAMALSVGLGKAADGDSRVFLSAWQTARGQGLVSSGLVEALQIMATAHDLPAEFVAGLGDAPWQWPVNPERGDEWTAPDGSRWRWDQPRDAEGQFLADDPATEAQESALQWLEVTA